MYTKYKARSRWDRSARWLWENDAAGKILSSQAAFAGFCGGFAYRWYAELCERHKEKAARVILFRREGWALPGKREIGMRLRAFAKINLGLDVLGKREDGYHEVRMIMQTIQMYDVLDIQRCERPGIFLQVNLPYVPVDERNLVYKAAKLLMEEFHVREGVSIKLDKFIPVAAGMAGGSSDAAAAFVGINRLFRLGLSTEELMERGVKVGADVPYCILRGTALAEGIGEKLTRLPPVPHCYVLVGKPGVNVSTKSAYDNLRLKEIRRRPDIDGMIRDIQKGDLLSMTKRMENVFEPGIMENWPVIRKIKELMEREGALKAMMSGSGPTVFGIFQEEARMEAAAEALKNSHLARTVFATEIFNRPAGDAE